MLKDCFLAFSGEGTFVTGVVLRNCSGLKIALLLANPNSGFSPNDCRSKLLHCRVDSLFHSRNSKKGIDFSSSL